MKNKEKEKYDLMVLDESKIHFNEIKPYEFSNCAILPYISSDKIVPNEIFVLNGITYAGLFAKKDKKILGITVNVMKDGPDEYHFETDDGFCDVNRAYTIIGEKDFKGFFILPNMSIAMDYGLTIGSNSLYEDSDYDDEDMEDNDDMNDEEFADFMSGILSKQKPC